MDLAENGLGLFALGVAFGILAYGAETNPLGFGLAIGLALLLFGALGGILLSLTFFGLLLVLFLLILVMLFVGVKDTLGLLAGVAVVPLTFGLIATGALLYGLSTVAQILSGISWILIVTGIGLMIWGFARYITQAR